MTKLVAVLTGLLAVGEAFNNPPGVKVWCGKAYMASNASFNPGGQLTAPEPAASPSLDLSVRPRMSLYMSDEETGSFVVDTPLSFIHGQPYAASSAPIATTGTDKSDEGNPSPLDVLIFDIGVVGGQKLASQASAAVNSTGNVVDFNFTGLKPDTQPYEVQITAFSQQTRQTYSAQTKLLYLPARTDGGSVTKIDNLWGGLMVQDLPSDVTRPALWQPLYPYSYYASWSGYFQNNASAVATYKNLGYNIVHIVPDGSIANGFDFNEFNAFLDECDRVGLYVMYDMRWSYLNSSAVSAQVREFTKHPSLLLWYTGDEPDGATDPLNGTTIAYNTIKQIDPYHPVSLVLNCDNFYYGEYTTTGTDIVMTDPYPVAINATYSVEWHTPCNSTYGDCGCDGCDGVFEDISHRLDKFAAYQSWLGGVNAGAQKPLWGVPQAFDGSNEYWARAPNAAEEIVMDVLSINHGAKGLVAWTWPTEPDLADITSKFAKVVAAPDVTSFLLGANPQPARVSGAGAARVDAAAWRVGDEMLVSVASLQSDSSSSNSSSGGGGSGKSSSSASGLVRLTLPDGAKALSITSAPWGSSTGWVVDEDEDEDEGEDTGKGGGDLVKQDGLASLETGMLLLKLAS